jgi:predicted dehydrogenase
MLQVFQHLDDGRTVVEEMPVPQVRDGHVLIRNAASVVSAGTERMLVDFGRAGLIGKARSQPERVREVLDKVRTEGLGATARAVRSRLGEPIALGYASAGTVIAVGRGVEGFTVGDRVASNGPHAQVVCVPATLAVRIPDGKDGPVPFADAAYATIGAIALQAVRLAQPTLGERFVVTGLGLVGLLVAQLLEAQGCRVLGIDVDAERLALAERLGIRTSRAGDDADTVAAALGFSDGRGVDGVVVAASTRSSDPLRDAAHMCRQRGRIVLVGVTGMELDRRPLYEKELTLQVSSSYGPGRYDPAYEDDAADYPFGFVRWTAGRNLGAFLDQIAAGRVRVDILTTHRRPLAHAPAAYTTLIEDGSALGIVLEYPDTPEAAPAERPTSERAAAPAASDRVRRAASGGPVRVAVIGAGNYSRQTLLPAITKAGGSVRTIVSRSGADAQDLARRFSGQASTSVEQVLADPDVDAVFIATRHDSHADLAVRALEARKHVWLEKPVGLTVAEVDAVSAAYEAATTRGQVLRIGFNRRHAPLVIQMKELLDEVDAPRMMVATVNAGRLPADHWTNDPRVGGGRIIGEACHHVDLLAHLAGAPITSATMRTMDDPVDVGTATITLTFDDGSLGTVYYVTNGSRRVAKERIEVTTAGRWLHLEDFRRLRGHGYSGRSTRRARGVDKGHRGALDEFLTAIRSDHSPSVASSMLATSRWTARVERSGGPIVPR